MLIIPNKPGTYILLLKLTNRCPDLQIGRSLCIDLEQGYYCYVGSALGPGGLAVRLRRHSLNSKRKHWHIDYLLPYVQRIGILFKEDESRLECTWAFWMNQITNRAIGGFGASDCRCRGHLFQLDSSQDNDIFVQKAQEELRVQYWKPDEITTS